MQRKLPLAIALLALTAPSLAGSGKHWFESMDKNSDGYLSAEELGEKKAHKIQKLDTDGDNLISRDEYDAYKAKKRSHKDDTA